MVSAALDARRVTNDESWAAHARHAFDWYLGQNELQEALYDASTGGCRDGLHEERVNENQGAESTVSFLLALLEMQAADRLTAENTSLFTSSALDGGRTSPTGAKLRIVPSTEHETVP